MLLSTALVATAAFTACSGSGEGEPVVRPADITEAAEPSMETADRVPATTISEDVLPESALPTAEELEALGYSLVNDSSLGNIWFGFHEGTDRDLAGIQYRAAAAANQLLMRFESVPVRVDGVVYDATFSVPSPDAIRTYAIVPDSSVDGGSVTRQGFTQSGPDGQLELVIANGVIGQENTGPGFIVNATVELCQGLELDISPNGQDGTGFVVGEEIYAQVKEGACNSIGYATDRAFVGVSYDDYLAEFTDQTLGSIAGHGAVVDYTIIDKISYNELAVQTRG